MKQSTLVVWGVKEFRALFPLWLACVIPVWARGHLSGYLFPMLAVLAYGFGSIALGAQSMGHEYGHGTLGILLSQPAQRRRILIVKLVVLAGLLAALGLVASMTLFESRPFADDFVDDLQDRSVGLPRVALLIGLCGLFVAPAMTMLTRSGIAGLVFTIALPGILFVGTTLVGFARFGNAAGPIERFTEAVFWPAMYGICAVGAAAGWWMFLRLEAVEGRGTEIHLPLWLRRAAPDVAAPRRVHGPIRQLVAKELHLHQMPVALAALYALAMTVSSALHQFATGAWIHALVPVTILYTLGIAALIGSFASAEERELGTLDWQLLMPMAVWKQWTVKAAVAIVLSLALGFGVPLAFWAISPTVPMVARDWQSIVAMALMLTAFGLYVSSLMTGGVRALVVTLPALFLAGSFAIWFTDVIVYVYRYFGDFRGPFYPVFGRRGIPSWVGMCLVLVILCGPLILLAYRNHRSGDRAWTRVATQLVSLAGLVAVVVAASVLLGL
jgi:hypothetical protein